MLKQPERLSVISLQGLSAQTGQPSNLANQISRFFARFIAARALQRLDGTKMHRRYL